MNFVQKLAREPNLVIGVVTSGLALAVLFGIDLSKDQLAGIVVFLGTLFALVRFITTPAAEVVVQEKPNGDVVAGAAAAQPTGSPVDVVVAPAAG